METEMELKIMVSDGMTAPSYAHAGDAGLDLRIREDVCIQPHQRVTVGTGVRVAIPNGYVGLCFPRSGLSSKLGISLSNCVGVIDSGYRGEIGATLINNDKSPHLLHAGERVCQLVIVPFATCELNVVDELDDTDRGANGFGSSGTL